MSRLVRPARLTLSRARAPPTISLPARTPLRYASNVPRKPLQMPADMPREDYAAPAAYTVSYLGRVVKYIVFTGLGLAGAAYLGFEGLHFYVERVCLAPASRAAEGDEYAWADENQAWTGGEKGGTDPRLGWRARHALRGAWICWEWGAGESAGAIGKAKSSSGLHPNLKGMIGGGGGVINRVDRGYELADEYIDAAIEQARKKGFTFPPELRPDRVPGPSQYPLETGTSASAAASPDPTAVDLVMLKAGLQERIGTPESLAHARELYEQVLAVQSPAATPVATARAMRLAHKLGDLALRAGDAPAAHAWWAWGLRRGGIDASPTGAAVTAAAVAPARSRGWWPFGSSTPAPAPPTTSAATEATHTDLPTLAPPVLRAATSLLISASAADAQAGDLTAAAKAQALARSLLPLNPTPLAAPLPSTAAASLQAAWDESRAALLQLHAASVAHARKDTRTNPLEDATLASERSEAVLARLTPTLPTAYTMPRENVCAQPAKRLVRDTLLTAAEAYYTQGALLERSTPTDNADALHRLEHAGECYERAMSLSAAESGTTDSRTGEEDGVGRGEEWMRYWRGYARVQDKVFKILEEGKGKK